MKKILFLLLAILVVSGCSQDEEQERADEKGTETTEDSADLDEQGTDEPEQSGESEEIVTLAETFIDQLAEGQYEEATSNLDETMKTQLTPESLEELWGTLQDQVGEFIDQEYMSTEETEGYQVVLINGLFAGSDVVFSITIDTNKQIAGFYIQ